MIAIGHVHEIVRYPLKSMAGISTNSAALGWHGLEGDRRFALRRVGDGSGFPWLSASRLPRLVLHKPVRLNESVGEPLPSHVRTPSGLVLELRSAELKAELSKAFGSDLELMQLRHGIFDEAPISIMSLATIRAIGHEAGLNLDRRRFRANIILETESNEPFLEDEWVGRTLLFGGAEPRAAVNVTLLDQRCAMVNIDPETAAQDPCVMKTIVRLNNNNAGVYATVVRCGTIGVGDKVSLT